MHCQHVMKVGTGLSLLLGLAMLFVLVQLSENKPTFWERKSRAIRRLNISDPKKTSDYDTAKHDSLGFFDDIPFTRWNKIRQNVLERHRHTHRRLSVPDPKTIELKSDLQDYEKAEKESLGFFGDIDSIRWNLLRGKVWEMSPNFNHKHVRQHQNPGQFYQDHYEPDFVCDQERRIGRMGDGGKWVCDPYRIAAQEKCLVYSIGSNNDFSFEESVLAKIGQDCEIHTFDMGHYGSKAKMVGVTYHQFGLGGVDDPASRLKSLKTVVKELGHKGRTIDIFKIDCEGCEFESAATWFDAGVTLRQILVELHGNPAPTTHQFFDFMYENNYVITHKEPNIEYPRAGNWYAVEFAFLKLSPDFFEGHTREKASNSLKLNKQ